VCQKAYDQAFVCSSDCGGACLCPGRLFEQCGGFSTGSCVDVLGREFIIDYDGCIIGGSPQFAIIGEQRSSSAVADIRESVAGRSDPGTTGHGTVGADRLPAGMEGH